MICLGLITIHTVFRIPDAPRGDDVEYTEDFFINVWKGGTRSHQLIDHSRHGIGMTYDEDSLAPVFLQLLF